MITGCLYDINNQVQHMGDLIPFTTHWQLPAMRSR
jgi:hypothetical protein